MLDMGQIRAALNELPFRNGQRKLFIGKVADVFPEIQPDMVEDRVRQFETELDKHRLILSRSNEDRDALYVVQILRESRQDLSWMREAMQWVSKITTVSLEMVLPGLAGTWLDRKLGTGFLTLAGFALGISLGLYHLIVITKPGKPK